MSLRIDTNIPCGNACDISIAESGEMTEIGFAADPHGGPECLWFCFRLVKTEYTTKQKVRLTLKHPFNMLGGGQPLNMRPVIRYAEGDWERLGVGNVQYFPDGRCTVSWVIDMPETFADVAYCYPYGNPEVETLIEEADGYWQVGTIGISQNAVERPCDSADSILEKLQDHGFLMAFCDMLLRWVIMRRSCGRFH